jgi:hypothetical protein
MSTRKEFTDTVGKSGDSVEHCLLCISGYCFGHHLPCRVIRIATLWRHNVAQDLIATL